MHRNISTYLHVCTCTQTHFTHTWTQSRPQSPTYTRRHGYREVSKSTDVSAQIFKHRQIQEEGRHVHKERDLYTRTHNTISHLSACSQTHYDTHRSIHIQGNTHTHIHTCKQRMQAHTPSCGTGHPIFGLEMSHQTTGFAAHVSPWPPASQVTEHALERGLSQVFREGGRYPPPHRELRAEGLRGRPPRCPRSTWEGPRAQQAVTPPKPLARGLY